MPRSGSVAATIMRWSSETAAFPTSTVHSPSPPTGRFGYRTSEAATEPGSMELPWERTIAFRFTMAIVCVLETLRRHFISCSTRHLLLDDAHKYELFLHRDSSLSPRAHRSGFRSVAADLASSQTHRSGCTTRREYRRGVWPKYDEPATPIRALGSRSSRGFRCRIPWVLGTLCCRTGERE